MRATHLPRELVNYEQSLYTSLRRALRPPGLLCDPMDSFSEAAQCEHS
jgi:hypothetical protein